MRAVITAQPTRIKRGGSWVAIDPRLAHGADGAWHPAATDTPLAFSGGGAGTPLVAVGSGALRLALAWPGSLPAPAISGDTATYRGVLRGVDLRLTADDSGYQLTLVVHDRAAAQALLAKPATLLVTAPGLALRKNADGSLTAVDGSGDPVFSAPAATMWDSSAPVGGGPARSAKVSTTLTGNRIILTPDRGLVDDPAAVYPLRIDPSFTAKLLNWTEVLSQDTSGGNVSFWNGQNLAPSSYGPVMTGYYPYYNTGIARAFFQMNTASVNGKHILGATFRITENWANNCTPEEVQLWETGGISTGTTFNHQPGWNKELSAQTVAKGWSSSCAAGVVSFGATQAAVDAAAAGWPNLTLGLRAKDESDQNGWKRFLADATLQIDYNSISSVGAMSTLPALSPQCVSGGSSPASNDPYLNSPTPQLIAVANDADSSENDLKGSFIWQSWNGSAWVAAGSGTDPIGRAANTETSFTVPATGTGALLDGTTYRWQVQIIDPLQSPYSGDDLSAWSPWCEFIADFTPPPAPTASAGVYLSDGLPHGGIGVPDTFTLGSAGTPDVVSYKYGFTDPPPLTVSPASHGGSASFTWTPPSAGPYTLYVQAVDAGGNVSAQTRYTFQVSAPAPMVAQWLLGEPTGTTSLADSTGNGHTATLGSGTLGAASRIVGKTALALDGAHGDYAQTGSAVLDTTKSYTVSAWVNLPVGSTGYQAVVSQGGSEDGAFTLQYDGPDCGCWNFTLASSDTANPATVTASSGTAALGVWTHLAGVYNAATGTASIYVNGRPAGTSSTTLTAPWAAAGDFEIGRVLWNGGWGSQLTGSVADVRAWQRVLYPSEIAAMVDPSVNGLVAANSFGTVATGTTAAGTVETSAPDPLGVAHDLVLQGTAQVPASGAGYQGTGLLLDGTGGWADTSIDSAYNGTPDQVLHTDQSFTVSAWLRLDGTSLPTTTRTALSQIGTKSSAFFLGYRLNGSTPSWAFEMTGADADASGVDASTAWSAAAVTTPDLGRWHQLTGVYDAGAKTLTLYVDGQRSGSATRTSSGWDATGVLMVGAAQWTPTGGSPGLTDYWPGAIDEVRAYQGVLTTPSADWQFTGCTGSPVACPDAGAGNHPLTLSSSGASIGDVLLASGQTGPVLTLDGAHGVAATTVPVVDTRYSFTVGAWIDPATLPASGAHVIVSQSGVNKSFFELQYNADAKQLCFDVFNQDSTSAAVTGACGPDLTAGQWLYAAGVYDSAAGTIKLYTAPFGGTPSLAATTAFTAPWYTTGTDAEVRIGAGYNGGGVPAALFAGQVADVQIVPGVIGDLSTLM